MATSLPAFPHLRQRMGRPDQRRRRSSRMLATTLLLLLLLALTTTTTSALALENDTSSTSQHDHRHLNVYGWPDRRSFSDPHGWPGRATGKLEFPDRQYCTATLVGPALILTARHCFADLNDKMVPARMDGKFLLGYSHGTVLASANLVKVWYGQDPTSDWALVRIDKPLGYEFGHLIPAQKDIRTLLPYENALAMTAYSRDKYEYQAGTDPVCSLKAYQPATRLLVTSCSGEAGASGAAIVDNERGSLVYAVFVAAIDHDDMPRVKVLGDFDHRFPNFATASAEFFPTWCWLITQNW